MVGFIVTEATLSTGSEFDIDGGATAGMTLAEPERAHPPKRKLDATKGMNVRYRMRSRTIAASTVCEDVAHGWHLVRAGSARPDTGAKNLVAAATA